MRKLQKNIRAVAPQIEQEVAMALIYKGKIDAIKLYKQHMKCRLQEAKDAVERIGNEIEPGPA